MGLLVIGVSGFHSQEPLAGVVHLAFARIEFRQGIIGFHETGPRSLCRLEGFARSRAIAPGSQNQPDKLLNGGRCGLAQ